MVVGKDGVSGLESTKDASPRRTAKEEDAAMVPC